MVSDSFMESAVRILERPPSLKMDISKLKAQLNMDFILTNLVKVIFILEITHWLGTLKLHSIHVFCSRSPSGSPISESRKIRVKREFHETTKVIKIDHLCIQIDPWVLETGRHRPMDIGAILAAD